MKVVVTGGTGFLGRHLVWRLAAEGVRTVFTGRNQAAAAAVCECASGPVEWQALEHGGDGATSLLCTIAENADAIVHCAALSAPWGQPSAFHAANVASTEEVLATCRRVGAKRLVHISTPSLYFGFRDRLLITENEPLPPPVNEYVRSKRAAEDLIRRDAPCETVILRPRALIGPWDRTIMPRLFRVLSRGFFPIVRGGRAEFDLTCVENAVEAIWLSLTRPLAKPMVTYNVTNGEPRRLLPVIEAFANDLDLRFRALKIPWPLLDAATRLLELQARWITKREPTLTRYGAGVLSFSQTLDISACRRELGYRPVMSLDDGIRRYAHWWQQQQVAQ